MRKEHSENGLDERGVQWKRDMDEAELSLLCAVSCLMEYWLYNNAGRHERVVSMRLEVFGHERPEEDEIFGVYEQRHGPCSSCKGEFEELQCE